jgi:hypothetical protein
MGQAGSRSGNRYVKTADGNGLYPLGPETLRKAQAPRNGFSAVALSTITSGAGWMAHVGQYLTDMPEERLAKYRLMATHAHESARASITPEARNAYIAIARSWETLAEEVERVLGLPDDDLSSTMSLTKPISPNP